MPDDLAFTRTASGLTRGLSRTDAFAIGLMFIQPIYAIWYVLLVGVGPFPGGNLLIALLISTAMCGIFGPLMWGILGGTMPRSGGEYVFNSRIISAPVALSASVANAVAGIYWAFFSATWLAKPSVAILAQFLGWCRAPATAMPSTCCCCTVSFRATLGRSRAERAFGARSSLEQLSLPA